MWHEDEDGAMIQFLLKCIGKVDGVDQWVVTGEHPDSRSYWSRPANAVELALWLENVQLKEEATDLRLGIGKGACPRCLPEILKAVGYVD